MSSAPWGAKAIRRCRPNAIGQTLTLELRLRPGLYRFGVRAYLDGGRLSRPAYRFLRVLD
ncbi:MAG: hypothetical protein ICV69_10485 [Thermoleophilaceae bacterium]|nr:hypothetical protein [Thermoleophilaceae bacterium]